MHPFNNLSADEMADITLALYESMGINPPVNPTVETVRAFMNLVDESYLVNVANN